MRLAIIDYGSGNLRSVVKSFDYAAAEITSPTEIIVTSKVDEIAHADAIVLPGVGAFADCKAGIEAVDGLLDVLVEKIVKQGVAFLGICVGMQLMASYGFEKTTTNGFGWIEGDVVPLKPSAQVKIPHMGWNQIDVKQPHPVFDGIQTGSNGLHAYFVHSYHMKVKHPEHVLAVTDYGEPITAAIIKDNMVGTQFHPEKSQTLGLKLIENFLRWRP
jgi:imidazole glycerol-phosphate synthase subunit HisH